MSRHSLALSLAALLFCGCKDPPAPPLPAPSASAPSPASASAAAASPSPPAPIDGALPSPTAPAPHALDRRAECAKESCILAHLVPDEVRPTLSDGAPLVLWEEAVAERSSLAFPRDDAVELMGVVLDGSLDLTAMETVPPKSTSVGGRWTAFRAPGGGVTLTGTAGKAVRVALVVAVAAPGVSLGAHLEQRDRPGAPPGWNWNVRKKRIDTVSFAALPDLAWGGGAYHARIGWGGDDHPAAVVDLLRFSADAAVAEHEHPREWETLALLESDGTLVRRPASGEQRVEARAGTIVTIPAGIKHAWKPSGKAPFFAIQVYAPPGPEQRFRKLAAPAP